MKKDFIEIKIKIIYYENIGAVFMSTHGSSSDSFDDPEWTPFF